MRHFDVTLERTLTNVADIREKLQYLESTMFQNSQLDASTVSVWLVSAEALQKVNRVEADVTELVALRSDQTDDADAMASGLLSIMEDENANDADMSEPSLLKILATAIGFGFMIK